MNLQLHADLSGLAKGMANDMVVAPNGTVRRQNGADALVEKDSEPWWANLLRHASGMSI